METLDFLLARPVALFIVLAFGAAIGIAVEKFVTRSDREKRKAYWRTRNSGKWKGGNNVRPIRPVKEDEAAYADFAADQLKVRRSFGNLRQWGRIETGPAQCRLAQSGSSWPYTVRISAILFPSARTRKAVVRTQSFSSSHSVR